MQDLTWNGITFADDSNGDTYSVTTPGIADVMAEDVAFPNASGRVLKIIGRRISAETSRGVSVQGRSYFADFDAGQAWITSIEDARQSLSAPLGTLDWDGGSLDNTRLVTFQAIGPRLVQRNGAEQVYVDWTAAWSQYE